MKKIIILNFFFSILFCKVLHIGNGQQYSSLSSAAAVALPGDTLLFHSGTYSGGGYIQNLKGTESNWITILAYENQSVIVQGGSTAWQFSDPEYLKIQGFIFENQTSNGVNIDDGGTFETPAENIVISDCIFRNINASGNNDLLKLSGVDNFEIKNCRFENGSPGGSGADMVGCHNGIFSQNHFENAGINAIQSKGGSQYITIERNFFKNCGDRTLNLGGSTSLQYFRPLNAEFEAADINVFSNIFISSEAPIAYVGSVRENVVNNTFYLPEKWVVRILQETVDPDRFAECGDNKFANNIIYLGNISTETNIGPNTRPSTFLYENNFWYNYQNTSWSGQIFLSSIVIKHSILILSLQILAKMIFPFNRIVLLLQEFQDILCRKMIFTETDLIIPEVLELLKEMR